MADLTRALEYVEPEVRRRVKAALAACAFISTEELERIAKLSADARAAAVRRFEQSNPATGGPQ